MEERAKRVWKYCPFSSCDTTYVQMWLENMADKGYLLSANGFAGPFANMIQQNPVKMRYQVISAVPKTANDHDMVHMIEESGWKYICKWKMVDIYASDQLNVEEVHTDAEIHCQDIKRMLRYRILALAVLCLLGPVMSLFQMWRNVQSGFYEWNAQNNLLAKGDIVILVLYAIMFGLLIYSNFVQKKQVLNNCQISNRDYKKYECLQNAFRIFFLAAIVLIVIAGCIMNI